MYWSEFGLTRNLPASAGHASSMVTRSDTSDATSNGRRGAAPGPAAAEAPKEADVGESCAAAAIASVRAIGNTGGLKRTCQVRGTHGMRGIRARERDVSESAMSPGVISSTVIHTRDAAARIVASALPLMPIDTMRATSAHSR